MLVIFAGTPEQDMVLIVDEGDGMFSDLEQVSDEEMAQVEGNMQDHGAGGYAGSIFKDKLKIVGWGTNTSKKDYFFAPYALIERKLKDLLEILFPHDPNNIISVQVQINSDGSANVTTTSANGNYTTYQISANDMNNLQHMCDITGQSIQNIINDIFNPEIITVLLA